MTGESESDLSVIFDLKTAYLEETVMTTKPKKQSSLREQQRAERKELILQAAYNLLVEKGYYEMSMDEIAAQVGISKGALYLHFASKDELVFMLIEKEIARFLTLIDQVIKQETTVQARLENILLETYKNIQDGQQLLLALNSLGLSKSAIREQESMQGLMKRLTTLFEEGKRAGELDATIPTSIMVSMFMGLMEMYDDDSNQLVPEEFVKSVSQILFRGLLA